VNPVVMGKVRAKIDKGESSLSILVHGDAAVSAQGIIYETIQMSDTQPFSVGGTIHLIANNQIGFTSEASNARSSHYASDFAKVIDASPRARRPHRAVATVHARGPLAPRFGWMVKTWTKCHNLWWETEEDQAKVN